MGRRPSGVSIAVLPKREPDANQEKLLRAAQKLFAMHGLAGTQIAHITAEAGTGISMFYRYFADKNDLLQCLLKVFFDEFDAKLADALEGVESQTPLEQLLTIRKVFQRVLGMLVARPDLTVVLLRTGFAADERIERLVRERIAKITTDLANHIALAEDAGLLAVKQKELLGHAVAGLVLQVAQVLILEGKPELDEAVDTCTRFTLGGLIAFSRPEAFTEIVPALRYMLQTQPREGKP